MKKGVFNLKIISIVLAVGNISLGASNDIRFNTISRKDYLKKYLFRWDRYPIFFEVSSIRSNKIYTNLIYRQMKKDYFWGGHIGWNSYEPEISIGGEYAIESFQLTVTGYGPVRSFIERAGYYQDTHSGGSIRVSGYKWSRINPFFIGAITRLQQVENRKRLSLSSWQPRLGVGFSIKLPYITVEPYWTVDWDKKSPYVAYSGFSMSIIQNRKGTSYPVSSLQSRMKETSQWYRPSYYYEIAETLAASGSALESAAETLSEVAEVALSGVAEVALSEVSRSIIKTKYIFDLLKIRYASDARHIIK